MDGGHLWYCGHGFQMSRICDNVDVARRLRGFLLRENWVRAQPHPGFVGFQLAQALLWQPNPPLEHKIFE